MPSLSTRNALIFGLGLSLPLSAAILIVGLTDAPESTSSVSTASTAPPAQGVPTTTVTATATVTAKVTATVPAKVTESARTPPTTPAAPPEAQALQGTVEISDWQNDIEYSASCAKLDVTIVNRSDTAVDKVTLHSKGEDARGAELTLPATTFSAGIAPFGERSFSLKICDKRMTQNEYGPAAIPTRITWTWIQP